MPASQVQLAKRELVKLLLVLAVAYRVGATLNRDSRDQQIMSVYRRIILRVHPDKGGKKEDAQALQEKKEPWDTARKKASQNQAKGRPREEPKDDEQGAAAMGGVPGSGG